MFVARAFAVLRLGLLLLATGAALAQTRDPRIARVEQGLLPPVLTERTRPMALADRMRHYRVPGLSVAVVDSGRFAWAAAWGEAEIGQGVPMTTQTLLQAASISKPVAALGAFKLAGLGRLDLDRDVNAQLAGWRLPLPAEPGHAGVPVTPRMLLSHTGGLTVHGFRGYVPGEPLPSLVQVLDGVAPANSAPVRITARPGTEQRYSGGGYVLLQQLMHEHIGEPHPQAFARWMEREILRPAGMRSSFFGHWPDAPLHQAAAGHATGAVIAGRRGTLVEQAAGGLWTTPTELARLTVALQGVLAGRPHPVVRRSDLRAALTLPAVPDAGIGQGFMVEDGGRRWGHDGRNAGFESHWRADARRAVVVMANANDAGPLMEEVVRAVAAAHGWTDLLPQRRSVAELAAAFAATPMFLRGSMNDWGISARLVPAGPGVYAAVLELPAGEHRFKFASQDWRTVDLGAAAGPPGPELGVRGPNLRFTAAAPGRYRFELDVRDPAEPRHRVEPAAP
jgi:CubicO group peptidase (beta-lactamase class C family)